MNILFDNPLANLYGPFFLLLYGFVIFFTAIVLAIVRRNLDSTGELPMPPVPTQIDPYEIAYLRGGTNEVARALVFSLLQKDLIEMKTDGKTSEIRQTGNNQPTNNLSQLEQNALGWFYTTRQASEVFRSGGLADLLKPYGETYQARLEQRQFLTDDDTRNHLRAIKWTAYLIVFGFGAYKALAAIVNGYFNIIFLLIMLVVGLGIVRAVSSLPRVTKLGKTYLERLQLAFENLKYESQRAYIQSNEARLAPQTTFAGVDPLLLSVGVFGAGVLVGTVYDNYNQTFQRAQSYSSASSSSCGSGCGSSCSSGSSSDSGGSSCGGGGCGGCGGGGCS